MTDECLFCKISAGKTETEFLFENERIVVFRDIRPSAPIHLLVVPKQHIRSLNDAADQDRPLLGEMLTIAKDMARREGIAESGYRVFFNVERGGGQVIFHIHLHLIGGWKK